MVELTPLYHGVALIRSLTLGTVCLGQVANVVYLAATGFAGLVVTNRRLERLLLQQPRGPGSRRSDRLGHRRRGPGAPGTYRDGNVVRSYSSSNSGCWATIQS